MGNWIQHYKLLILPFSLLAFTVGDPTLSRSAPMYAVTLRDGITAFAGQPRLISVTTTNNSIRAWSAAYYFTIELPEDATEPLKKLEISQTQGFDVPRYEAQRTRVFAGDRRNRGRSFTIEEVAIAERTITLTLEEPIPPGTQFTLGLYPVRNPNTTGVYLFGVTAFPQGEKPQKAFLGFGRLHFYHPYF
ncbi:DUF2808 domain-containing protein [Roseofilum capinflatum]|uniref:DUF2808 domain-containing protein n=1 Tax=Roseofilum capinflatum BLCC-M114 TaxID=3022440 RepID=A0ABT7B8V6_9CYAN|nr:DUF2808 domain-containing protein [Roseofilum capinflatum]MDJ1175592.1 DUF2808 domain-containing protein [Roseofilum capinflatum BLCC-M114]